MYQGHGYKLSVVIIADRRNVETIQWLFEEISFYSMTFNVV